MELWQHINCFSLDNARAFYSKVSQTWDLCRYVQIYPLHILQVLPRLRVVHYRIWFGILLSHTKPGKFFIYLLTPKVISLCHQ